MMKDLKNICRKIITCLIIAAVTLSVPVKTGAATRIPENVKVTVNGGEPGMVRAINSDYENNIYISLRDLAVLFSPTDRAFGLNIDGGSAEIVTGTPYSDELEHSGWSSEELTQYPGGDPGNNALLVDGENCRYSTIIMSVGGVYDCFISPMDLAMILDINMIIEDDESITIDTSSEFDINPARMETHGFFDGINTVVVGDATTGEVFYGYNTDEAFPIASTTKLMTYLLTMDAISAGTIGMEDTVTISKAAADLSASKDGTVPLAAGWEVPVAELIQGAMLPSSNECALSLAEYVGGTEASFVEMMNKKAGELGLESAEFYNSNGLPIFTDDIITAKKQNKMSGYDMFRLCSHIITTYPQIKDITSLKTSRMDSLNKDLKNANGLLYNMSEINGLKTGTTDRAGACLVTSLTVNAPDGSHDIVVVELGAENSQMRLRVSELLARYGKNVVEGDASAIGHFADEKDKDGTVTAGSIVKAVVDYALRRK